jgi:hypothetical protein
MALTRESRKGTQGHNGKKGHGSPPKGHPWRRWNAKSGPNPHLDKARKP